MTSPSSASRSTPRSESRLPSSAVLVTVMVSAEAGPALRTKAPTAPPSESARAAAHDSARAEKARVGVMFRAFRNPVLPTGSSREITSTRGARHLMVAAGPVTGQGSAPGDPHHGPADRHEVAAVAAVHVADGNLVGLVRGGERGVERRDPLPQLVELGLEVEDLAHPGEAHAVGGELLDAAEERDVAVGVAPAPTLGAAGLDEALALVDAQRLGVDARQLGRHRDDVERALVDLLVVGHDLHPQVF